jgi:hypothetical protein
VKSGAGRRREGRSGGIGEVEVEEIEQLRGVIALRNRSWCI